MVAESVESRIEGSRPRSKRPEADAPARIVRVGPGSAGAYRASVREVGERSTATRVTVRAKIFRAASRRVEGPMGYSS
jgi:hypothetical protein